MTAEFVRRLNGFDSLAAQDPVRHAVVVSAWDSRELQPPVRLHLDPAVLGRHLRYLSEDGATLFPDVEPVIGALQLFLVHVQETIETRRPGHDDLILVGSGLEAVRSAPD